MHSHTKTVSACSSAEVYQSHKYTFMQYIKKDLEKQLELLYVEPVIKVFLSWKKTSVKAE